MDKYIRDCEMAKEMKYNEETDEQIETKKCPRCLHDYKGYPALSRRDNKTDICSDCGTEEALYDFAMSKMGARISLDLGVYQREALFAKKIKNGNTN